MGWIVLLPTLAVLYVVNKRIKGRVKLPRKLSRRQQILDNIVNVTVVMLAAFAGCGLTVTFLGGWIAACVGIPGAIFGSTIGMAFAIAVTLVLCGTAVADILADKSADSGAQVAAFLAPTLLALVIGGVMGHTGRDAVHTVNTEMASIVTQIGGS